MKQHLVTCESPSTYSFVRSSYILTPILTCAQCAATVRLSLQRAAQPSPSSGNAATYMLWIVPNGTLAEKAAATRISGGEIAVDVYLVGLSRLISITGSGDLAHKAARVQNVRITGLTFTHTAQAFVPSVGGKYEVPSNQDW